jgi:hypothetical protein
MKKLLFILVFMAVAFQAHAFRLPKGYGVGFSLFDPTGFTVKKFIARRKSFSVAAGYNKASHMHINGDFVYHFPMTYRDRYTDLRDMAFYVPLGGKLFYYDDRKKNGEKLESPVSLAVRAGVGAIYFSTVMNLELFLEIVPTMDFFPATEFYFDFALGARYYF